MLVSGDWVPWWRAPSLWRAPWWRALALPRPRITLWYSSLAKTWGPAGVGSGASEGPGACGARASCTPLPPAGPAWTRTLGRKGRMGLGGGLSESWSESLPLF